MTPSCEACADLGETCHDCLASRTRVEPEVELPRTPPVVVQRESKALRTLGNLRKREIRRVKKRLRTEKDLQENGITTGSMKKELFGRVAQRVVVGHKSRFYNPAHHVANAIAEALDPHASPPQRFVPKRRKAPRMLNHLFRQDGKLNSDRFYGWDVNEVAEVNPAFLGFLAALSTATDEDRRKIRLALVKASLKKRERTE